MDTLSVQPSALAAAEGPWKNLEQVLTRFEIHKRESAEKALLARHFDHLVSFRDVGKAPLLAARHAADRIEFEFDDAHHAARTAFGYRPPQVEDMRLLIDWLRERRESLRVGSCLFQCERGVSCSTAAACIAFRVLGSTEQQALVKVRKLRAHAEPNALMLQFARRLLGN